MAPYSFDLLDWIQIKMLKSNFNFEKVTNIQDVLTFFCNMWPLEAWASKLDPDPKLFENAGAGSCFGSYMNFCYYSCLKFYLCIPIL